MIRLSACPDKQPEQGFIYTIQVPGDEPFITGNLKHAAEHLAALGVEDPGSLIEQVRQWREIEVH
jgi:hypothetical protein